MLWLWKPVLRGTGAGRLRRRLRRVRRRLGPAREAEVHRGLAGRLRLHPDDPGLAARAALTDRLERRRRTLRREAADSAGRAGIGRLLRRTGEAISRVDCSEIAAWEVDGRRAWRRARALAALAAARDSGDVAQLHVARVALKRWRYAAECAHAVRGRALSGRVQTEMAGLAELQSVLGTVQDLALLLGLLEAKADPPDPRLAG